MLTRFDIPSNLCRCCPSGQFELLSQRIAESLPLKPNLIRSILHFGTAGIGLWKWRAHLKHAADKWWENTHNISLIELAIFSDKQPIDQDNSREFLWQA